MLLNKYFSKKEIIVVFSIITGIIIGYLIYNNTNIIQYKCKNFIIFNQASENDLQKLPYISFSRAKIITTNKEKISNFEDLAKLLRLKEYEKKVLIKRIQF